MFVMFNEKCRELDMNRDFWLFVSHGGFGTEPNSFLLPVFPPYVLFSNRRDLKPLIKYPFRSTSVQTLDWNLTF